MPNADAEFAEYIARRYYRERFVVRVSRGLAGEAQTKTLTPEQAEALAARLLALAAEARRERALAWPKLYADGEAVGLHADDGDAEE